MPTNGTIPAQINSSIQTLPTENGSEASLYIHWIATIADGIIPWGKNPQQRDQQLRAFYKTESILASTVGIIAARNAAFEWKLEGPSSTVERCHEFLQDANFGRGMVDFVTRFSVDLATQDKGAFVEIIRDGDSPDSPCIGIANLDASRCMITGNPLFPVIYTDRAGKMHKLPSYRVYHATEMPTTDEAAMNLQFCAVSRVLKYAQNHRDYVTYEGEKVGGRNQRAVHLVSGINSSEITGALKTAQDNADNVGFSRYLQPAIASSVKPDATISHVMLELASLPSGFNQAENFRQYVAIIAMAFLTDYLELAPLPGGGLGSATQSVTLDKKSKEKGAELFRKIVANMMNNSGILPRNVEFGWIDSDYENEKTAAELASTRAKARNQMLTNGEIDERSALQMALDAGDVSQEVFDYMMATKFAEEEPATEEPPQESEDLTGSVVTETENPEANNNNEDGELPEQRVVTADEQVQKAYSPKVFAGKPRR